MDNKNMILLTEKQKQFITNKNNLNCFYNNENNISVIELSNIYNNIYNNNNIILTVYNLYSQLFNNINIFIDNIITENKKAIDILS